MFFAFSASHKCGAGEKFAYNMSRFSAGGGKPNHETKCMNSQLEHLQTSIEALIGKYQATVGEKRYLVQEVARLQETQQQLVQQHQATVDDLNLSYNEHLQQQETEANQQIEALRKENAAFRALLEQSAAEIRHLLARLPVAETDGEQAA